MAKLWTALGICGLAFCGLAFSDQPCLAQANAPINLGPITASFALVPGTQRTPDSIPLLLRLRNNTRKPVRVLDLFTPDLFVAAVYFELEGPALGLHDQGLFGMEKVSFPASWHDKFIKIKPGRTEDSHFDLAQLTQDKRRIPPGTYTLGGLFSMNRGYPPAVKRQKDIYQGGTSIPPMPLVISSPTSVQPPLPKTLNTALSIALPAARQTYPVSLQAKRVP